VIETELVSQVENRRNLYVSILNCAKLLIEAKILKSRVVYLDKSDILVCILATATLSFMLRPDVQLVVKFFKLHKRVQL